MVNLSFHSFVKLRLNGLSYRFTETDTVGVTVLVELIIDTLRFNTLSRL